MQGGRIEDFYKTIWKWYFEFESCKKNSNSLIRECQNNFQSLNYLSGKTNARKNGYRFETADGWLIRKKFILTFWNGEKL